MPTWPTKTDIALAVLALIGGTVCSVIIWVWM